MAKTSGIVKKKWVQIVAPELFGNQVIGESYVAEVEQLVGRHVAVSLMTLTNDPQKQSVTVSFRIVSIKDGKAMTELTGYKLGPAALKKMVRRRRDKVSDSFVVKTKDGKHVRIKPVAVTRGRASGGVLTSLRHFIRAYLARAIADTNLDALVMDIVGRKLQYGLQQQLHVIYPVGACDIRMFDIIAQDKLRDVGLKVILPPQELPILRKKQEAQA